MPKTRSTRPPQQLQREQLWLEHQDLVRQVALHYALLSPEPIEDLIQVGWIGLLRAADGYDASAVPCFDCFARPHIRGAILHHLRDRAWMVRLPRRQAERWQARQAGQSSEPLAPYLAQWQAMNRAISLEASHPEASDALEVLDPEESQEFGCQEAYAPWSLDPDWHDRSVEQMLALVSARQSQVLRCVVLQGWSYRRTAASLKVSAATVQRLLHRSLEELRNNLSCSKLQPTTRLRHHAPSAAQA